MEKLVVVGLNVVLVLILCDFLNWLLTACEGALFDLYPTVLMSSGDAYNFAFAVGLNEDITPEKKKKID